MAVAVSHRSVRTRPLGHPGSFPGWHPADEQPDGRFTITFNGEIFNFGALRQELEDSGVPFSTGTDTEVVLQLYARQGAACLQSLRGMFAFAIWDHQEETCFLARDPFGIKPLYYADQNGNIVFASELRSMIASGFVPLRPDEESVCLFLQSGSVPEPRTLLEGVSMLEAGCHLTWRAGHTTITRWWEVGFPVSNCSDLAESVQLARLALLDSIEHHFVSDVPVGLFLSGGIDSTALLALANATGRDRLQTFSIGVDDSVADETGPAARTAKHFGAIHHEMHLSAETGAELFAKFLDSVDQPTIDGFNTYCVASLARHHGMKVVLSGLGGDEVFGGYPSFRQVPRLQRLHKTLAFAKLNGLAGRSLQLHGRSSRLRRLGSLLTSPAPATIADAYSSFRSIRTHEEAKALASLVLNRPQVSMKQSSSSWSIPQDGPDAVSALELTHYMRNQLLRDSDVMSMAHGLELRVPLVDKTLFESVAKVPASLRLRMGKMLLVDAVPEIPPWIKNQPKRGFLFPYQKWLATPEWKQQFDSLTKSFPMKHPTWYERWSLFMLVHWLEKHRITPSTFR
ncbi:asparagine synthase (glutamine-hydrolyzing) [Verrucomicrobium spinosum]|uniref:asparagine synthase (glutamine-hydrolyzing) n=1 Tax=Verrucomicrobium spinosum TaxID=2736 RepID=UPI001C46C5FE|nr:asparagine synthase (glutamine-hydrolyzing) [Verrucomicrobium spinosum]